MCRRRVPADTRESPLTAQALSFSRNSSPALLFSRCIRSPLVAMRLMPLVLALVFANGPFAKAQTSSASNAAARARVIEMTIGDESEPIMAEYIDGGISEAARQRASLILITMDTPGGLGTSMEDMIQHILSSPVPVVVYVSPAGARGASAGFFILLSADVAAQARRAHTRAAAALIALVIGSHMSR